MARDPSEVLEELEGMGYTFKALKDQLSVLPTNIPPEHVALIREHQRDIHHIVGHRARCGGRDRLEQLRQFVPKLWRIVRLRDGRSGLVWGVSPRGVMVSLGPTLPIITVDPKEIEA